MLLSISDVYSRLVQPFAHRAVLFWQLLSPSPAEAPAGDWDGYTGISWSLSMLIVLLFFDPSCVIRPQPAVLFSGLAPAYNLRSLPTRLPPTPCIPRQAAPSTPLLTWDQKSPWNALEFISPAPLITALLEQVPYSYGREHRAKRILPPACPRSQDHRVLL